MHPYLELIRLNKPVGTLLLLFPCWWGLAFAGSTDLKWYTLFAIGALIMRSAGCVINDLWDRNIDKQVERTKNRPLASGLVSIKEAFVLLGILLLTGFIILLQFPTNTILLGAASLPLIVLYPLMKRFFPIPQLFLGLVFNWGVLMGYQVITGEITSDVIWLYAAAVFWTLAYDTIYALQDIEDDRKISVKSSALFFGKYAYGVSVGCYFLICIIMTYLNIAYVTGGLWFFTVVMITDRSNRFIDANFYSKLFKSNAYIGFLIFITILLEKT